VVGGTYKWILGLVLLVYLVAVTCLFLVSSPLPFASAVGVVALSAASLSMVERAQQRRLLRELEDLIASVGDDPSAHSTYEELLQPTFGERLDRKSADGCVAAVSVCLPAALALHLALRLYGWGLTIRIAVVIVGTVLGAAGLLGLSHWVIVGTKTLRAIRELLRERAPLVWARMRSSWEREWLVREAQGGSRTVVHSGLAQSAKEQQGKAMLSKLNQDRPAFIPDSKAVDGDPVNCTVFAPPKAGLGETLLVQVFAHMPEQAELAGTLAQEFDEEARRRAVKGLQCRIPKNTELKFDLVAPGFAVDDSVQTLIWEGSPASVQFGVTIPPDYEKRSTIATVTVSRVGIPVGCIKFKIAVCEEKTEKGAELQPTGHSARHYGMAFVSYASADRDRVLVRAQVLRVLGIRCFQDVLDLDPGVRWEKELYERIRECDILLLFWSENAKQSAWVRREVQFAIECQRQSGSDVPEIRPVIIERPPPEPWEELAHLHFNDKLIYVLDEN